MKKLSTITLAIAISGVSLAQKQSNYQAIEKVVFESNETKLLYAQFLDNQSLPLSSANSEVFVIDNKTWTRPYGETEYCLTPSMDNVLEYENRISSQNDVEQSIYKSNFNFVNIEVTGVSRTLLSMVNIIVPHYVESQVICYLPQIDIEYLINNQVTVAVLPNYGTKSKISTKDNEPVGGPKALIWNEGFESNAVPGTNYSAVNGSVNCGWGDVSCYKHSGSWSVWCSGNGAACNVCTDGNQNYVNGMSTAFANATYVNVTGYSDILFKYWIDLDLNNTGTNDELKRYDNLGTGSWTLQFTATSANPWDGTLWNQGSVSYVGQTFTQYQFQFGFSSNSAGTSFGVYLDDLEITGTSTVGVQELEQQDDLLMIYPNPSNGQFSLIVEQNVVKIVITDLNGKIVKSISNITQPQMEIDLSAQSKGVYFIKATSNSSVSSKKIILE